MAARSSTSRSEELPMSDTRSTISPTTRSRAVCSGGQSGSRRVLHRPAAVHRHAPTCTTAAFSVFRGDYVSFIAASPAPAFRAPRSPEASFEKPAWPERLKKVTVDDVKAVAQKYLVDKNSVTGYLLPAPENTSSVGGKPVQASGKGGS